MTTMNVPEMPNRLDFKPRLVEELKDDEMESKRTKKVLQTLSAMSKEQERKRSAVKHDKLKKSVKDKVSKFTHDNADRLAASTEGQNVKRRELMNKIRKLHEHTTETWSRVDEFTKHTDAGISLFKDDIDGLVLAADTFVDSVNDTRANPTKNFENEAMVVRRQIKNKLLQLEKSMVEYTKKNAMEDQETKVAHQLALLSGFQ
jgi:hypothetical protein